MNFFLSWLLYSLPLAAVGGAAKNFQIATQNRNTFPTVTELGKRKPKAG
jgi:hypothetical protein